MKPHDDYSLEAEQAVIGSCLIDSQAFADVADVVTEADFFREDHKLLFRTLLAHDMANKPSDVVSIAETLDSKGLLSQAGDLVYIGKIAQSTPTSKNARTYAGIVRDRAITRRLHAAGKEIAGAQGPTAEQVERAQKLILEATDTNQGQGPASIMQAFPAWVDALDSRMHSQNSMVGLSTGLTDLDRATCGMEAGDLWILAARPGMGKSTLAQNIIENVAVLQGKPVLFFSLEMPNRQLLTRSIASLGKIPFGNLRSAQLSSEQWSSVTAASKRLKDAPYYVDETPALTLTDMRARARRWKHKHGMALLVVDYLQLMRNKAENRTQEITEISRGLKALAKDLSVPVLALSQLNRSVEARNNKRPMMSDLRESGSIEQDADVVLMLYREEAYNEEFLWADVAELQIAKQRNGELSRLYLTHRGEYMRFDNCDNQTITSYKAALEPVKKTRGFAAVGGA